MYKVDVYGHYTHIDYKLPYVRNRADLETFNPDVLIAGDTKKEIIQNTNNLLSKLDEYLDSPEFFTLNWGRGRLHKITTVEIPEDPKNLNRFLFNGKVYSVEVAYDPMKAVHSVILPIYVATDLRIREKLRSKVEDTIAEFKEQVQEAQIQGLYSLIQKERKGRILEERRKAEENRPLNKIKKLFKSELNHP